MSTESETPHLRPWVTARWEFHSAAGGLGPYFQPWDALNQALWGGHPLCSAIFTDQLLRHFGDGSERLCVARQADGRVDAMAILKPQRAGVWASFLPSQAPMGPVLFRGAGWASSLLRSLPGRVMQLDLLCVDDQFSGQVTALGGHPGALWHAQTMSIRLVGTFEDYWNSRSNKLRQNLRRYRRKLEARGSIEFRCIGDPHEMPAAVRRYGLLESAGWKGEAGTAVGTTGSQASFYRTLLEDLAKQGRGQVFELWVADVHVASRLVAVGGELIVMLKTTYNEDYAEGAPGLVMLETVIRDLFECHPGTTIEFYTNASRDQMQWATHQRPIHHVTLYRWPWLRSAIHLAKTLRVGRAPALPPHRKPLLDAPEVEGQAAACVDNVAGPTPRTWTHTLRRKGGALASVTVTVERDPCFNSVHLSPAPGCHALLGPALELGVGAQDLVPLLRHLCLHHGKTSTVRLSPMETASHEYSLLREALGLAGLFTFEVIGPGFWRLNPNSPDWPDAHSDADDSAMTSQHRLQKDALPEDGLRIEVTSDVGKMPHAIHALAQAAAGIGLSAARCEELIAEVIAICTQGRSAWLGTAWSGPTPLALQIWGVRDGHAQIYRHLCAASAAEAGHLLTARMLAQALAHDKVSMLDDLSGGDAFAKDWHFERHERWGLVAYDARTAWGFLRLTREIARRIAGGALRRGRLGPSATLESVSSPRADPTAGSTTR